MNRAAPGHAGDPAMAASQQALEALRLGWDGYCAELAWWAALRGDAAAVAGGHGAVTR